MNDLTIHLQPSSKVPLYEQIYVYIKQNIQDGHIKSGERLPSTRTLCRHLEVSRSTVELAYEQLLSEGYVEAKPCRGYFVAEIEGVYRLRPESPWNDIEEEPEEKTYRYDFTPNGVDLDSFPYNTWRKLSKECLMGDCEELFRLGHPQGEAGLRSVICTYLHQARGVNCSPEQIVVGAGNDYLLMVLATVIGVKHRVAFENPTYRREYRLFQNMSCEVCTVDMDEYGMSVSELKRSGADIAFVMPSHQYPLGIVMPVKRRLELMAWARQGEGRYIIEDDYDSEFRYKGKPIPALQGYDHHEKVIYIGTFSRSVAPSIRISYMVLPRPLLQQYREKSGFLNSTVSKADQMLLQRFIEGGYYERHLNKMRAIYKGRHDMLLGCLKGLRGQFDISGEYAGVHLLLHGKRNQTEEELIARASERDVKVYGLSEYYVEPRPEQAATILLGYANMPEEQIKEAVQILQEAWK